MSLSPIPTRSFVVTKAIFENKKIVDLYLSTKGEWIKSKSNAWVMSRDNAEKVAKENAAVYCAAPRSR
jgi:hypothetical protein